MLAIHEKLAAASKTKPTIAVIEPKKVSVNYRNIFKENQQRFKKRKISLVSLVQKDVWKHGPTLIHGSKEVQR